VTTNFVMVVGAACIALFTLRPRLVNAPLWRATVTPLASIIGSGFLVAGPILGHVAGNHAWIAMASLCAVAYLFGAAIRHNIVVVEPMLATHSPGPILYLERASDLALAFAYFVSVSYYLNLFASFALRADGIIDETSTRWLASGVILSLGLLGTLRGLRALEHVEIVAVGVKLALIGGLIGALTYSGVLTLAAGGTMFSQITHRTGMTELGTLLGLVILVQGFETSRYLGHAYDPALRIRTMRFAQLFSTLIYVAFIFLITPYFKTGLPESGGETAIIDMLQPLGSMVAPLIIFAALGSQLSAAVADMNGAGGLLASATEGRIRVRTGYFATACVAVAITWSADIFEIIALASKAFVIYYGLQSLSAAMTSARPSEPRRVPRVALFGLGTLIALAVLVFGLPAHAAG
jgi:hypothetical protein